MHQRINGRLRASATALTALFFAAACGGGEVDAPGGSGDAPGGSAAGGAAPGVSGSGGAAGSGGALPPVVPTTDACPTQQVEPTPLRRLTRYEYANTVKHLLNVDPSPVNDLPIDEVTDGFSNNAAVLTVSALHAEKYVLVSEALAKSAVQNLSALTACDSAARGEPACAAEFARSFGRRAFRRPISAAEEQAFMTAYAAGREGGSHAEGIEVMIRAALQSSHFLYRLELTAPSSAATQLVPLDQYELATRLSFLIWAAGPDDALLDAASRGELATRAQVAATARAMLADPKARVAIAEFYNQWLGTSRLQFTGKDTALFPSYSAALRDAMALELPAFTEHVMWTGDHKLSTLLTAPVAFVSGPLAELYGVSAPSGSGATPTLVTLGADQGRAGILTQAGFLSVQAHPDQTSPVLRGKFVRTKLLCQPPPPPPPDIDITPPEVGEGATARERFSAHATAGSSCAGCHVMMDPIGFAFENFDAMGRYRTTENGRAIDVSGEVAGAIDPALGGAFTGVRELAVKLADSEQVRDCVATHWFRFASGRGETQRDSCSLGTLQESFGASGGDLVELVVAMTQLDSFWYRAGGTQ